MKIGIITLHKVLNYGAILQAYALYKSLSQYGEVYIVDYETDHVRRDSKLIRFNASFRGFLAFGKDLIRFRYRRRVHSKFRSFREDHLKLVSIKDVRRELGFGACYAGSDQIWNPRCVNGNNLLDLNYFLEFVEEGVKKYSYASSAGGYTFDDKQLKLIEEKLHVFDYVAVRESGLQTLLSNQCNIPCENVVDPTLLLTAEQWTELCQDNCETNTSDYIFLYSVPKIKLLREALDKVKRHFSLPVLSVDQNLTTLNLVDDHIRDAGPLDFLCMIKNAQYVVTDSFHGVCFSIIFNKPFIAVVEGAHSSRIESLLNRLGLSHRIVKSASSLKKVDVEYSESEYKEALKDAVSESADYLFRTAACLENKSDL